MKADVFAGLTVQQLMNHNNDVNICKPTFFVNTRNVTDFHDKQCLECLMILMSRVGKQPFNQQKGHHLTSAGGFRFGQRA